MPKKISALKRVEKIRDSLTILEFAKTLDHPWNHNPSWEKNEEGFIVGPCYLCKANNKKSFKINEKEKIFYCSFCEKSGDIVCLVAAYHNESQMDAIKRCEHLLILRELCML